MEEQFPDNKFKRHVAFKFRIGALHDGKPIFDGERLRGLEINGMQVMRVNLIANITEKYLQEGEKKFGSVTLDDATGQIKGKLFGDDIGKLEGFEQGDTVLMIGLLRSWNNEIYITPEIIKKCDPKFLLIRKLEIEREQPKMLASGEIADMKDKILGMIKTGESEGGVEVEKIILDLKESPDVINQEIKKLLENGVVYEPRPGRLRYLG